MSQVIFLNVRLMASNTKRRRDNTTFEVDEKKGQSSYGLLKRKLAENVAEMEGLKVLVKQLRSDFLETQNQKEKLAALLDVVKEPTFQSTARSTSVSTSYQAMKKKQTMLVANNKYLKSVIVKQREELEALKEDNGRLQLGKEQLEQGIVACRRAMQELSNNITILSNDNDVQASELKEFVQKEKLDEASQAWQRQSYLNTKKAVLRAFGWKHATADPTLLRAACGFWDASAECTECGDSRSSLKRRMDLWIKLTCEGFNGRVHDVLEKIFVARNKFNVVELCRKSDVESKFNGCALQSISECQPGKKKYDRGLLCSDTTLRRLQQKVHTLAKRLGFSSLPQAENGNVWCWGDEKGDFITGVNRYIYEIYVKARCTLVTQEKPWIVPLTGDLARVNYRGKAITMCGPKRADPRLPCQQGTMKTSNQSREMYTPAAAGYVDEGHVMKYFEAMVAAFRDIEARGYCVVDGVRHIVFIDVIVVADMAYLHKYLRRGGGSHACTHFCFLCSVNKKYRAGGYPGGCRACRLKGIVYDEASGAQKCRHHDVCDSEFLKWQRQRLQYLTEVVKPRIPKSSRPFYESKEGLKQECLKLCKNDRERVVVYKKKSIAQLEKWLKADGRTRGLLVLAILHLCPFSH